MTEYCGGCGAQARQEHEPNCPGDRVQYPNVQPHTTAYDRDQQALRATVQSHDSVLDQLVKRVKLLEDERNGVAVTSDQRTREVFTECLQDYQKHTVARLDQDIALVLDEVRAANSRINDAHNRINGWGDKLNAALEYIDKLEAALNAALQKGPQPIVGDCGPYTLTNLEDQKSLRAEYARNRVPKPDPADMASPPWHPPVIYDDRQYPVEARLQKESREAERTRIVAIIRKAMPENHTDCGNDGLCVTCTLKSLLREVEK